MEHIKKIKLVECPRDAMQGWEHFIPTETKIKYINALLQVGFDVLDFGSFVSPKAIPQLADTHEVVQKINHHNTTTKLLSIVANSKGAKDAMNYEQIKYIGFPFSISETFQQKNTNSSIAESVERVAEIQELCVTHNKELVIYISMGFGNPYGDAYTSDIVLQWVQKLASYGIRIFQISDTIGVSNPQNIAYIFNALHQEFKTLEFGAHFHSEKDNAKEKIEAALLANCTSFDSALFGIGGCPMAQNDLVGNIDTIVLLEYLHNNKLTTKIDTEKLKEAEFLARSIFL